MKFKIFHIIVQLCVKTSHQQRSGTSRSKTWKISLGNPNLLILCKSFCRRIWWCDFWQIVCGCHIIFFINSLIRANWSRKKYVIEDGKFISYLKQTSFYLPLVPLWALLPSPANSDDDGQNEKGHNPSNNSDGKIEVNLGYMIIIVLWSIYRNDNDDIDATGMSEESQQSSNNSDMKVEDNRWDLL